MLPAGKEAFGEVYKANGEGCIRIKSCFNHVLTIGFSDVFIEHFRLWGIWLEDIKSLDSSREDRIKYFERHIAELKKSAKQNVDKIEKQRVKTEQAQVEVEVLRNELLQMEGKEQDSEDLSYPFFFFLWLWLKTKQTKKSQGSSGLASISPNSLRFCPFCLGCLPDKSILWTQKYYWAIFDCRRPQFAVTCCDQAVESHRKYIDIQPTDPCRSYSTADRRTVAGVKNPSQQRFSRCLSRSRPRRWGSVFTGIGELGRNAHHLVCCRMFQKI